MRLLCVVKVCVPCSVVLRPPSSQVDLPCLLWWDTLDGLTVALRWRMSCFGPVTAWRPPALVRPTPGASVLSVVWASCSRLGRVLAYCYLFYGKLHSLQVAFVVPTFWVWHFGYRALSASPRGIGHLGLHHQGHLACAVGLGWS